MSATTHRVRETAETWLSVQDASAMLGVSPATLRRWSANGEVEAFTTPGGHRRYALSTVQSLLPGVSEAPVRLSSLGSSSARLVRVVRRHARSASNEGPWLRTVDASAREELRGLSRALTQSLVEHLDAAGRSQRAATLRTAENAARELGAAASRAGCGLEETLAVFLRFRSLVLSEISSASVRRGLSTLDATALVTRGGDSLDRMLQSLVAAFTATDAGVRGR